MQKKINLLLSILCAHSIVMAQNPQPLPAPYSAAYRPFVRTWELKAPESNVANVNNKPLREVMQITSYSNGFGNAIQTVTKKGSLKTGTSPLDVFSINLYDALGREAYKYLPSPTTVGDATKDDGLFKLNPLQQQTAFYNTQWAGQTGETNVGPNSLNWAYSFTGVENSPMSRAVESFAPGSSWMGSKGSPTLMERAVTVNYWINTVTDEVRQWMITEPVSIGGFSSYNSPGAYPAGSLLKTVTTNENGLQSIEYKDKAGKLILKKTASSRAYFDDSNGSGHAGWICTYFIYDNKGNLRCVVMPKAITLISPGWVLTDPVILAEQCYRFEYDNNDNPVLKKTPGAGETYEVYDNKGRVVMTQDANMRDGGTNKWLVTLYDHFDRPVQTGLWTESNNIAYHTTQANSASGDYPFSVSTVPGSGYERLTRTGYDHYGALPSGTGLTVDLNTSLINNSDYFVTSFNMAPDYAQSILMSGQVRGKATWNEIKVLNSIPAVYLYTINIYDEEGRLIQVKSKNISNGTDIVTTQYSWDGKELRSVLQQQNAGVAPQTTIIISKFTYDDLGRVTQIDKKVRNSLVNSDQLPAAWTTIVKNEYDALGQLVTQSIGSKKDPVTGNYTEVPLETMAFEYNVRGWLLSMNKNYLTTEGQSGTNKFGLELGYDQATNATGQSFTGANQYDGSIRGMVWKSDGDDVRRKYDYKYDDLSRLLKADFIQQNPDDHAWNNIQIDYTTKLGDGLNAGTGYDINGNILNMTQYGYSPAMYFPTTIDELTYNYTDGNNSNRLLNVIDAKSNPFSFNQLGDFNTSALHTSSKTSTTVDFAYDPNGNMVKDYNKDLVTYNDQNGVQYNYGDLPELMTFKNSSTNKGSITYVYGADMEKLKKIMEEQGVSISLNGVSYVTNITKTTTYLSGIIYSSEVYSDATVNAALGYTERIETIPHEEGRIRLKLVNNVPQLAYDYFITDHQGSIRMVLTEEEGAASAYEASMEMAVRTDEEQLFTKIPETDEDKPGGFDGDPLNQKVINLFNSSMTDQRVGPTVVLKVMSGDKFKASVFGWYQPGSTNVDPLPGAMDLLYTLPGAMSQGFLADGKYTWMEMGSGMLFGPVYDYLTYQNTQNNSGRPKAFLNWMVVDDVQMKLVNGNYGAIQVPTISGLMEKQVMQAAGGSEITVTKNGYLVVFVTNESQGSVYFDNLKVDHIRGPLAEETHYYPLGMQMKALGSRALLAGYQNNRFKYQGQEFEGAMGLNYQEFDARMYDPQIGRWHVPDPANQFNDITPYNAMANKWPGSIDPDGEFFWSLVIAGAIIGGFTGAVAADIQQQNPLVGLLKGAAIGAIGGAMGNLGGGSFLAQVGWGAAGGAVTGGIGAALNGNNVLKGAAKGAAFAAVLTAVQLLPESINNAIDKGKFGTVFGTNDGQFDRLVRNSKKTVMRRGFGGIEKPVADIDLYKAQKALKFYNKKFGGPELKYNLFADDPITSARNGSILIPTQSFLNGPQAVRVDIAHETGHYLDIDWTKHEFKDPTSNYGGDGIVGYHYAIRHAGQYGVGYKALLDPKRMYKFTNQAWREFSTLTKTPAWQKYVYLIPQRRTLFGYILK